MSTLEKLQKHLNKGVVTHKGFTFKSSAPHIKCADGTLINMLQNVQSSMEAKDIAVKEFEAQIKAYQAETQRISAVQAGMSPEQIQDIVMGTIAAALDTGDLVAGSPEMPPQTGDGNEMR